MKRVNLYFILKLNLITRSKIQTVINTLRNSIACCILIYNLAYINWISTFNWQILIVDIYLNVLYKIAMDLPTLIACASSIKDKEH